MNVTALAAWLESLRSVWWAWKPEAFRVKVVKGKNGALFLDHGVRETARQVTGATSAHTLRLTLIHNIHSERVTACARLGISYRHVICPNKEAILPEDLPEQCRYESQGPTFVSQYFKSFPRGPSFYDRDVLRATDAAYYRSDTNWTDRGALVYFREALKHFGDKRALERLDATPLESVEMDRLGDLGLQLDQPPEPCTRLHIPNRSTFTALEGNIIVDGYVRLERSTARGNGSRKALVLHDSSATALYFFIGECYQEALFIYTPHFDAHFVAQYRPDVVWFFQAERYLPRVPRNGVDYATWVARQERRKGRAEHGSRFLKRYFSPGGRLD